jgi:hypothetical protein
VCREDLVFVTIDERLEDAFDVRADRRRISRPIIGRRKSFSHKEAQKAQSEN